MSGTTSTSDEDKPTIWRIERTGRLSFVGTFKWFVYISCSFSILVFVYALYDFFNTRTLNDFDVITLMVVGAGWPLCMALAMRHESRKKKPDREGLNSLLQQANTMSLSDARSMKRVESAALKYTQQGIGDIPARLLSSPELSDTSWPDAVLLSSSSLQALPTPRSHNIPFEPLRLGHDRARCRAMLREFVMDACPQPDNADDLLFALSSQKVYPASAVNLMWVLGPILLVIFLGIHVIQIARSHFGLIGMWCGFLLTFASFLCWLGYGIRLSPFRKQCWILPGAILLRWGGIFASKQKQAVFLRGQGTLWYDAQRKALYMPASGKLVCYVCSPTDGVFALWGWLNTAPSPHNDALESIGLRG